MDITSMVSNARTQPRPQAPTEPFTGRLPPQPPEGVTLSEGSAEEMEKSMQSVIVEINAAREAEEQKLKELIYAYPRRRTSNFKTIVSNWKGPALEEDRRAHLKNFMALSGVSGLEFRQTKAAWAELKNQVTALYPGIKADFGFTVGKDGGILITDGMVRLSAEQKEVITFLANQSKALTESANAYATAIMDYVRKDSNSEGSANLGKFHLDAENFKDTVDLGRMFNTEMKYDAVDKRTLTPKGMHADMWYRQIAGNGEVRYALRFWEE